MTKFSLDKNKIKILLLEGLHSSALDTFHAAGYTNIDYRTGSLSDEELEQAIADVHFIGIRSRTTLTEKQLENGRV